MNRKRAACSLLVAMLAWGSCHGLAGAQEYSPVSYQEALTLIARARQLFVHHFDTAVQAEERTLWDLAADGTVITQYTLAGIPLVHILRYYGESGNRQEIYYLLANGWVYVDALDIHHAISFSSGYRTAPYKHNQEEYLVIEGKVHRLSPDHEALIATDKTIFTWEECLSYFAAADDPFPLE